MGIETRYHYIYYMVLNEEWLAAIRRRLEASSVQFSWGLVCKVINRGLEENEDWTLNNLKVDYSQHSEDIDYWITKKVQHKERPVFIQLEDGQPIITSGSGKLFVLYEEEDDDDDDDDDGPDAYFGLDGLAGAGGRL
jgi:hypothetical protein